MATAKEILKNAKKIAIVRTDKLGDMVLTLPMLKAVKRYNSSAKLHIIASSYTEFLLKGQSLIDDYYFTDKSDGGIAEIFKNNDYDAVLFPRPKLEEVFPAFMQKIPLRVGSAYRWYSFLFNNKIYEHRKTGEKSEAQYNVNMVNFITGEDEKYQLLKPYVSPEAIRKIKELTNGIGNYIIIHPGGGGSAPKWSVNNFAQLTSIIASTPIDNSLFSVILTGTEAEMHLCNYIESTAPNVMNMCGKLSLEETAALIAQSECLITNSTGILHIAAAAGTKTLAFFSSIPAMNSTRWGHNNSNSINLSDAQIKENFADLNISVEKALQSLIKLIKKAAREV